MCEAIDNGQLASWLASLSIFYMYMYEHASSRLGLTLFFPIFAAHLQDNKDVSILVNQDV